MRCPHCQHENREGARFCAACGSSLAWKCPACGNHPPPGATFCDHCGTPLTGTTPAATPPSLALQSQTPQAYTPVYLAEKILTSKTALEGERKQVTVLFADLKDSTELIRGLDPEAAQQLLDPAIHHMMDAVHRFEGTVNQVLGDGLMALFGAPIAHEDHGLRACYAALAMQGAMRAYTDDVRRTRGLELRMRVGLNSGEVVVRAIGNDLHMDYSAVGETTHLAARMEQLATPGSIRLTAATLCLVEGLVQVTALGPVPVRGLEEPVEVFELVGASHLRRRLQAAAARGLPPFVGRQDELEALHQALAQARTGHGQVVAVVGEAGVGKSRLVHECIHSHRTQGWRVLESACVSYGKATPYFPITDLLKCYCRVDDGDDARTIRAKVTGQVLTLDETLQDTVPALLALLDAVPDDSPWLQLDPSHRRQRTLEAVKRVLLRESQVQPLFLVCEDLHWIDTETQAVLDRLVESLPKMRLLLLVNYRPDYQHDWGSKTYYRQLRLDPLPAASAEAFLGVLLGEDPSLAPLTPLLIAHTEGNPFFLEESTRTLVETGVLVGTPGAYRPGHPLQGMPVPATVQAVLAARIDRLPPEDKRLLQTAAVIGHEVPRPLLQAIAELPEAALHHGLVHLQASEFLYETRLFPEQAYTFKHALTQQVAYETLLQERRRTLHARIVEALEALAGERVAEQVERLAHHALRGEVWDKALAYGRQAGERALARSAHREAVACFEQALVAQRHLPESRETLEQAIDLRFDLRQALVPLGEFGRIPDELREAETLAKAIGDQERLGRVCCYMTNYFRMVGDYDRAIDSGKRALAIAAHLEDLPLQVMTREYLGIVYHHRGEYRQAMDFLRQNVAALRGDLTRERFGLAGLPAVISRTWLIYCLASIGEFPEGMARGEEAIQIAEAVDHPYSRIRAYISVGFLSLIKGDLQKAIALLEQGLKLSEDMDISVLPIARWALSSAYAVSGRIADALRQLEQPPSHWSPLSIRAYLRAGRIRINEAFAFARKALEFSREHQERGGQAYALCLLGDITAQHDPPDTNLAEAHYQQALALAEALGMRPLQAYCHHGLGTIYVKIGQPEHARAELESAMELYRTMDMTFWLPQTEAALAQVEGH
jgi:class 3 adenylate cyclase/tetratricopeptide (TPR) repeat protein